ncbi:MAG: flagellar filament capping protein FliD [Polyangiaceae bacterium]
MSNAINLASLGLGGIDTTSLVSTLVSIEEQPMNQLTTQQQNIQSAQTTISSFSSAMSALSNAAQTLSDPSSFTAMSATSSDSSLVATASGTAPAGQWSVSVSSIAQEQRTLSSGFASNTTALGLSGNLGISIGGGATQTVSISPTDTLSDISNEIASSGLRLQSSLVYDGSNYHLLVSGLDTGKDNAITFDESGLAGSPSLGLSVASNTIQQAQDANLTVGGIPVTSATNQIANAIPGVTLAVTQPTTSPATIQVNADTTTMEQNVQAFVTAYNAVVSAGHTASGYGTQAASNPVLQGDQAIRSSLNQLGSLVGEAVPGASGAYNTLGSVGISLNTDGTLSLDTTALSSALAADPASVQRLFVTDQSNGSQGVMGAINSMVEQMTTGSSSPIQAELSGFSSRNTDLSNQITDMQQQATTYQTQLQNTFAQMNATLATYKTMAAQLNADSGSSSSSSSTNSVL